MVRQNPEKNTAETPLGRRQALPDLVLIDLDAVDPAQELTCVHARGLDDRGLCPQCRVIFEADPRAFRELGDHLDVAWTTVVQDEIPY